MASSTPSAPIKSSRGAADTTAGRIYFSTPSAQVRVPVGDLVFPPPTSPHTILLGGKLSDGGIIIPSGRRCTKIRKKVPKTIAQYRKYPIPYLNTLRNHSISLYITKNTILIHCRNYTVS